MGGRGGASGVQGAGSADGVIATNTTREIKTYYREARGRSSAYYGDEVLEATTDGHGNVTFSYARGGQFEKTAKTNRTSNVTYNLKAGALNGIPFNINWSKVNSISGQTYSLRQAAKQAGLSWDGQRKNG